MIQEYNPQEEGRLMEDVRQRGIVFIGAGNVATHLAKALSGRGFRIAQVYSCTEDAAQALAAVLDAPCTTDLSAVIPDAALYIVALRDEAFVRLLPEIVAGKEDALWVHTAGSIPMQVWEGHVRRYGVLYPMQTFSKQREVDFAHIPLFVEAVSETENRLLKELAALLSDKVYEADSVQRKSLHLAAVFACNFTNHLYAVAEELLTKYGLPFEVMLPLIDETARKVHRLSPRQAQTGPAVRYDRNVMEAHLQMLAGEPAWQELYRLLSDGIHRMASEEINNTKQP